MINKALTLVSNMFCNLEPDRHGDLLQGLPHRPSEEHSHPIDRFGFEPEITMKCAKRKLRIYEVPISYHGRTYEEGKKIGWKDGVKALGRHSLLLADRRSCMSSHTAAAISTTSPALRST